MNRFVRISVLERVALFKALALMFRAGIPIGDMFDVLAEQTRGSRAFIVQRIAVAVRSGVPLHEAFAQYPSIFPSLAVSLIKAGEASGTLDENFERLAQQFYKDYETRRKIIAAASYPILVLAAALFLSIGVVVFILPRLLPIFRDLHVDLPFLTRALLSLSSFLKDSGVWLFVGVVALVVFVAFLRRLRAIAALTHPLYVYFPIIGSVTRTVHVGQVMRTLHTLLRSGIPIDEGLLLLRDVMKNHAYRKDVDMVRAIVREGVSLGEAMSRLSPSRWPPMATRMIHVGETSGRLEEVSQYLGDFYETEFDDAIKNMTALLEPILLLCIGMFVGLIALAVITPIYQLTSGF